MLRKIKSWNVYVQGKGYAGKAEDFNEPKLSRKVEGFRGAGMNVEVEEDMGMEKMESDFTLREVAPEIMKEWGACSSDQTSIVLRKAVQKEGSCESDAHEVFLRGILKEIDMGTTKSGDATKHKYMFTLRYYKYVINDEVIIEIDAENMIEMVDGVDILKSQRDAIGL